MAEHLRKVCAFAEAGVASPNTQINVDAVPTEWPVERVIPLSLIANELLTNAVKHAPAGQDPTITLRCSVRAIRCGSLFSAHT